MSDERAMTDTEVADVLDRAVDELLMRGWYQGDYSGPGGRVCALGAVSCAVSGRPVVLECDLRVVDPVADALANYLGAELTDWNDDRKRTEDDVRDALRGCAKHLRERAAS